MKRSSLTFASAVTASLLVACMSPVIGEKTATIIIATAPAPGSRALTGGWPMGGLPVFSDITVSVLDSDGNEMLLPKEPVVSGNSITVTVSAGKDLTLVVDAKPDWDATASAYSIYEGGLPTLVTMYSGSKGFSVNAGETASVTIALATSGTKILLPNPNGNFVLGVADSIYDETVDFTNSVNLIGNSYFAYDKYGFLYVSNESYVNIYSDIGLDSTESIDFVNTIYDIAISESDNRLYSYYFGDGAVLYYVDLDDETREVVTISDPTYSIWMGEGGVAVDSAGFVYVPAYLDVEGESPETRILKLSIIGNGFTIMDSAFFSNLDLGYWHTEGDQGMMFSEYKIEDMTIVDDVLYIAVSDIEASNYMTSSSTSPRSRGKIIAVSCSTMEKIWETGWSGDLSNFPAIPSEQFYGPRRFVAIAPKRLFLLDDGFSWSGSFGIGVLDNVTRIVEVDIDDKQISATGFAGTLNYFVEDFSSYQVY